MSEDTTGHDQISLLGEMTCPWYLKIFNERDVCGTASCCWEVDANEAGCVVCPNKELSNNEIQPKMEWAASLVSFSTVSQ